MSRVALVTDTTHYLPREVIERHGVSLVSLYVNWDGRTDRESELGDYGEFYAYLQSGGELPSTSQPSVGDFLAVFEPLIARRRGRALDPPLGRDLGHRRRRRAGAPGPDRARHRRRSASA